MLPYLYGVASLVCGQEEYPVIFLSPGEILWLLIETLKDVGSCSKEFNNLKSVLL